MQAAWLQDRDKAWALHDKMFEGRKQLSADDLERYAGEAGLDVERFKQDLERADLAKQVEQDTALAQKLGANGTPTFYVNGRPIRGARGFDVFKQVIDEELSAVATLEARGVAASAIYETRSRANAGADTP
jgi:protein-disulfide isomerase